MLFKKTEDWVDLKNYRKRLKMCWKPFVRLKRLEDRIYYLMNY